jgi:signal transduction histidine kinase
MSDGAKGADGARAPRGGGPREHGAPVALSTVVRCWLQHTLPAAAGVMLRVGRDPRHATIDTVIGLPRRLIGRSLARSTPWLPSGAMAGAIRTRDPRAIGLTVRLPARLEGAAAWCLPLSLIPGAVNLLIVLTPSGADATAVRGALRVAAKLLRPVAGALAAVVGELHPAISAKREWEITVDLLPDIICLVDRGGRVLRINRAVESWGIATIRTSLGVALHRLLHPDCQDPSCPLGRAIEKVWRRSARGIRTPMRITDPVLGRTLDVSMRRVTRGSLAEGLSPNVRAACLIADVTTLSDAQQLLHRLNGELEARVEERTADLRRANGALTQAIRRGVLAERSLRDSRNELSLLSIKLMHAQERERKRISQELHDAVGQSLSAVKYTLERSMHLLEHPRLGSVREALEVAVVQVRRAVADVRAISSRLRPPLLDDLGPVSAIRGFCREWSAVYPLISVETDLSLDDADVPSHLALGIFRIVQESMNNIAKHSGASAVRVSLGVRDGRLVVEVCDNGVGFSAEDREDLRRRGSGWRGMLERAEHDGGELSIDSRPGKGVSLRVEWPLERAGTADAQPDPAPAPIPRAGPLIRRVARKA